jgi:hypothetical protein
VKHVVLLAATLAAGCGFEHGGLMSSTSSPDASDSDAADTPPDSSMRTCPQTYAGGYRPITTTSTWLDAEHACEADAPGLTHLVVLDDDAERAAMTTAIQSIGDAWVGIVRDPGGSAPWPWRYVTGGAAAYQPWEGTEPNNMSADQYVAVLRQTSGFLYDYGPTNLVFAVCECDMKPSVNADYDPQTN